MASTPSIDLELIARQLGLPEARVARTIELLEDGNTLAFLTRYRKDITGGLDESQILQLQREVNRARQLAERKAAVLRAIESQGLLTAPLRGKIAAAATARQLADHYLPFKAKKQTLATLARQRGLEPLANEILAAEPAANDLHERAGAFVSAENDLPAVSDVLAGAGHIIAEKYSERADLRERLHERLAAHAELVSTAVESADSPQQHESASATTAEGDPLPAESDGEPTSSGEPRESALSVRQRRKQKLKHALQAYFDFREPVTSIRLHRVLAINRGERAKILRVRLEGNSELLRAAASELIIPVDHPHSDFLNDCLRDALSRLILPSLERDIRRELTERAEEQAVQVFARNLRKLFLQRPVRGHRVLAIDPGFKSGCKLAALDAFGNVLAHDTLHLIGGDDNLAAARKKLVELVTAHDLSVIAIGNGTACRETELLVAELITGELAGRNVQFVIVNGAGASAYSTSMIGREELSDYDAIFRGAISIGRRLLDPLSELVKIHPSNIGVGMYQHDMKAKHLRDSLDAIVDSCVNFVGVDVNTASSSLLQHVSGLNQLTARRIYDYRLEHGPFRTREQLKDVPGIGEATYIQAAGFLRITDGDNPLDATWIHPESYDLACAALGELGLSVEELSAALRGEHRSAAESPDVMAGERCIAERSRGADVAALAKQLGTSEAALSEIFSALSALGRDPRDDLPPPVFRSDIVKIDDLAPGMELTGTVVNVVDFGAFVDIGIADSALVHISRLADRYISDPQDVVSIGDVVTVWVTEVDKARRRVSLTAIPPQQRPRPSRPSRKKRQPAKKPASPARSSKHRRKDKKHPAKRQPAPPITPGMAQGTEPMRSFSDLLQFYEVKDPRNDNSTDH